MRAKKPSDKAKMAWLMGTWLGRRRLTTCPFSIHPPELVCGHFFEPALQTNVESSAPYVRNGIARTTCMPGPLSVSIYKDPAQPGNGAWILSREDGDDPCSSMTNRFEDVASALLPCIQQCLAREPLLAIALSKEHRYEDGNAFRSALAACLEKSAAEHTLCAMSGEQIEVIMYAAIQQASGKQFGASQSLFAFCEQLIEFLEAKDDFRDINPREVQRWGIPKVSKK